MEEVRRMLTTGKKWPRYFAIVIALVIIMETIVFTLTSYARNDANPTYEINNDDKMTASEISNMTGVTADEIIKHRKEGKTWNQILELIKNNPGYRDDGSRREEALAQSDMDEAALKKLKEDGFTEEEIVEAKSLVERAIFQLGEIINMKAAAPFAPDTGMNTPDNKEEDTTIYYELTNEINLSEAVHVILNLRDYMGTIQAAFDEYLYSLQLGIDISQYLARMEEYKKEKQQKLAVKGLQHIITSADIEEKMLEVLQSMNKKTEGAPETKTGAPSLPDMANESLLPEVQTPSVQSIKPQNPAEELILEIDKIKNNSIDQSRR